MKRLSYVLLVVMLIATLPLNSFADSNDTETVITYLEDGSYFVETLEVYKSRSAGSVTGTKTSTWYNDSGTAEWKAVLTGTFTYTGTNATCTASNVTVTIYNSNWYTISKSASRSGAMASASVAMGYKMLGVTTKRITATPTLTCDKNGNLS